MTDKLAFLRQISRSLRTGLPLSWQLGGNVFYSLGRQQEKYINSFPNFMVGTQDGDGESFNTHFVALFSREKTTIPLLLLHV